MSTLHTVNKSPFERNALQSCIGHLMAGDAVLMIEDGVLGARKGTSASATVQAALANGSVYALASDLGGARHQTRASDRRRPDRRLRRVRGPRGPTQAHRRLALTYVE